MSGRLDFILRANAEYIEEQHRRWSENPRSVPEDWALFFAGVDLGETDLSRVAVRTAPMRSSMPTASSGISWPTSTRLRPRPRARTRTSTSPRSV
jgi:2-oxoglutarate dehydrogenase complex dehydrogenase (E1) component-like enzyme